MQKIDNIKHDSWTLALK